MSYSVLSPYIMATLGVRTTMVVAGTVSAGLLALLLVRSKSLRHPLVPAVYGAVALTGNAFSGRVTYGLGTMFGLAAVAVIFAWPERWRTTERRHVVPRGVLAVAFSALATLSSPVAGLFLGVVAAALWLGGRRPAAYALGLPPVVVIALCAWLFPFSGRQPMAFGSAVMPVLCGVAVAGPAPRSWRTVRIGALVYVAGVLAVWAVPSQIGSNVTRFGLLFGGVLIVAIASEWPFPRLRSLFHARRYSHRFPRPWTAVALTVAVVASSTWQVSVAVKDVVNTRPTHAWTVALDPLVQQLQARNADKARVEVVPARSHREASALMPYVNLARGWNRQADAERNPLFYEEGGLTPMSYRRWLDRWAVAYVVLPVGYPDAAAVEEAALVSGGLDYLHEVWSDTSWRLFQVDDPTPLADEPAVVVSFDATQVVLRVTEPGRVLVRVPYSPWLSLVDETGKGLAAPSSEESAPPVNLDGCLGDAEQPPVLVPWARRPPTTGPCCTPRTRAPTASRRRTSCPAARPAPRTWSTEPPGQSQPLRRKAR